MTPARLEGVETREADSAIALSGVPTPSVFVVFVMLGFLTLAHGGYFQRTHLATTLLLVAALGLTIGSGTPLRIFLRPPFVWFAALVSSWAILRAAMAGDVSLGWSTAGIALALAAVYAIVAAAPTPARIWLVRNVLTVAAIVAVTGWVGVAFRIDPLAIASAGVWRATSTITYANAAAALFVCTGLVAIGLRITDRSRWSAVVTMILMIGAGATQSRAGAAALLAGLIVLGFGVGWRRLVSAVTAPMAGALVALGGLAPSLPSWTPARPAVAGLGLVTGVALTVLLATRQVTLGSWRSATPTVLIAAVAVVGAAMMLEIDLGDRMTITTGDRTIRNEVALDLYADDPLIGTGPGRLWLTWQDSAGRSVVALHVHNEYLQVLVQLGAIGALLVAGLLLSGARAVRQGRHSTPIPSAWWGIAAALTALLIHSAFDFLWHIPVIPLLGAALAAAAAPTRKEVKYG